MPTVVAVFPAGEQVLQARIGETVMQVVHRAGHPGFGECSGSLACATCHVVVAPEWAARLPPPVDDEDAMLDTVFGLLPTSRLSCQITMSPALDGIRVTIPQQ